MKLSILGLFLLSALSTFANADQAIHPHSAIRLKNESAKDAFKRYRKRIGPELMKAHTEGLKSALDEAQPLKELDFSKLPSWGQAEKLQGRFEYVRNLQFIKDKEHDLMRRSTWLYPDDGCFARAGLMVQHLIEKNVTAPAKVFIFGNLNVKTKNSPDGSVSWWYHVAPIVNVDGHPYVLDPAISPKHPLKVEDWVKTMTKDPSSVKMSLCQPHSYYPSSACKGKTNDDENALGDQKGYLTAEWDRVKELGRDPEQELGESPPWTAE